MFDTVDHSVLLRKLELYRITGFNLAWFKNYLSNRKQYIQIGNDYQSEPLDINCGVTQGSILGTLLFILYVKDFTNATKHLDPIMFADDTNSFYSNKNIKSLFEVVNKELQSITKWFNANKLSLNTNKMKYSFFHSQEI